MKKINKTLTIGTTPYYEAKKVKVTIDVKLEEKKNTLAPYVDWNLKPAPYARTFAMSGSIGKYCCGQCIDEIGELFPDNQPLQELIDIWKEWHLNNLQSGTEKQTAAIEEYKKANPKWKYDYSEAVQILKDKGLYKIGSIHYPKEDKDGKALPPHPYKYGQYWLLRPLPKAVFDRVLELIDELNK